MSTEREEELRRRFRRQALQPTSPPQNVIPLDDAKRMGQRVIGRAQYCSDLKVSDLSRKHSLAEFSSLYATEPVSVSTNLSWAQLLEHVAPLSGILSTSKESIGLYVIGAFRSAPWVGKTRDAKDEARRKDPAVPFEGLQRSNSHVVTLDAAVGDIDDKPSEGIRRSVWDVSKRLDKLGVAHIAYGSWSNVSGKSDSGRIVAPIDRPIDVSEWVEFFRGWQDICGGSLDPAGKAASQSYYKFGIPHGFTHEQSAARRVAVDGYVLSVDKVLARSRQLAENSRKREPVQQTEVAQPLSSEKSRAALALAVLPADDYSTWLSIGAALRREFGADGFSLWDQWSKKSQKYDSAIRDKWDTFDPEHDTAATLATLHFQSREAARSLVEKHLHDADTREAVITALHYLWTCHRGNAIHEHLRQMSSVPAELDATVQERISWQRAVDAAHPRTPIVIGPGNLQTALLRMGAALSATGRVFERDGLLVRVVRLGELIAPKAAPWRKALRDDAPVIVPILKPQEIIVEADPHVAVFAAEARPATPIWSPAKSVMTRRFAERSIPNDLALSVIPHAAEMGLPRLESVLEHPALRADGSILDRPGHDGASGCLYIPNAEYPPIPLAPTRADALAALERICTLYTEFPFADPGGETTDPLKTSSFSAALAALFTRAQPISLDCMKPIFALNGPAAGSGKTTLDAIPALVFTGREPVTHVLALDRAEAKKEIFSLLLEGHLDITLDNVNGLLDSPEISSLTTAEGFTGRILGASRTAKVKPRANLHINGNGLALKGDLRSRAVWHELDPRMARPDERKFSRDLRQHIRAHRPALVVDVLTILVAFMREQSAGRVPASIRDITPKCRFVKWEALVRKPLLWLGLTDPLGNRDAAFATDMDDEHLAVLFDAIAEAQRESQRAKAQEIANAAAVALTALNERDASQELRSAVSNGTAPPTLLSLVVRHLECSSYSEEMRTALRDRISKSCREQIAGALGNSFSARDLLNSAISGPAGTVLREALSDLGIDVTDPQAGKKIGFRFRSLCNHMIGDRRLIRSGTGSTAANRARSLWAIERVDMEKQQGGFRHSEMKADCAPRKPIKAGSK